MKTQQPQTIIQLPADYTKITLTISNAIKQNESDITNINLKI